MSQHEESQEQMQMNPTNTATAIENAASDHSGNSVAEQAAGLVAGAETMIVVSKVKKFIRDQGGLNTSEDAITALTQKVIEECLKGIERAKSDGRKTFMGRDVL